MEEKWRDVKGYEGLYKVSNFGNIYSDFIKRNLSISHLSNGYAYYRLLNKNKKRARLVAENFIPNPKNKPQVNHKDGNKLNDNVNNLEWCTASENMRHAFKTGLINPYNKMGNTNGAKLNKRQVRVIKHILKERWFNINNMQIARFFGVTEANIRSIKKGNSWRNISV